jgi:GNAT superfamily N-acetyltransferase
LNLTIRELNDRTLPDFLAYFDNVAFADNPEWARCYCFFYHANHDEPGWDERPGSENRHAVCGLVAQGAMKGYLAYLDGKVVGWCHAAPRTLIPNLQKNPELDSEDMEATGAIVCFVVAKAHRGTGVATQLLEAALQGLRQQGLTWAEGYPRRNAVGEAANFHGPLSLFSEAGFETIRELPNFWIVRKRLTEPCLST